MKTIFPDSLHNEGDVLCVFSQGWTQQIGLDWIVCGDVPCEADFLFNTIKTSQYRQYDSGKAQCEMKNKSKATPF